jgi:hypothetical protein
MFIRVRRIIAAPPTRSSSKFIQVDYTLAMSGVTFRARSLEDGR